MGKTVYFRSFEMDDAKLIHQWKNNDDMHQFATGLNKRTCFEEDEDWVKARMRHNPYQVFWAICAKDTDRMIGYVCLTEIHYINSSANFSGVVIGDPDYHDGFAWMETYLFVLEYAFERLNLNRLYGHFITEHKQTRSMGPVFFWTREGVMRQAAYKNGQYYDIAISSILRNEYFEHKAKGEYEMRSLLKRFKENRE